MAGTKKGILMSIALALLIVGGLLLRPLNHHHHQQQTNPFYLKSDVQTLGTLLHWVHDNITYREDSAYHTKEDFFQPPEETLRNRAGDCEDFSILYAALVEHHFDLQLSFVVLKLPDDSYHMACYFNKEDLIIDPTGDFACLRTEYLGEVERLFTYQEVMSYATSLDRFL